MAPRSEAKNKELRAARTHELLVAAQRVFAKKGYHAANVADVAAEAKVSQGTVYHYFESKEVLLMAVFESWETGQLQYDLQQGLALASTSAGKLSLIASAAAQRLNEAYELLGAEVEFWSHIPRYPAIRKGFRRMFKHMANDIEVVIQQGVKNGEFRSVDTQMLSRIFIATYDGLVLQWLADKKAINWQTMVKTLTSVMLQGLVHG